MQSLASVNSAFAGTGVAARAAARRAVAARIGVQASFFKTSTATKVRPGRYAARPHVVVWPAGSWPGLRATE